MPKCFVLSIQFIAATVLFSEILVSSFASDETDSRRFLVETELYSFIPKLGIESYRHYASDSGSGYSTTGTSVNDDRQFLVEVESLFRAGQFFAIVRVKPKESDSVTVAKET